MLKARPKTLDRVAIIKLEKTPARTTFTKQHKQQQTKLNEQLKFKCIKTALLPKLQVL